MRIIEAIYCSRAWGHPSSQYNALPGEDDTETVATLFWRSTRGDRAQKATYMKPTSRPAPSFV